MKPIFVGIAGGSGSGKSTFVKNIKTKLTCCTDIPILSMDSYYNDRSHVPHDERDQLNYDHPDAYDLELFLEHLEELKNNKSIDCPCYDFAHHARTKESVTMKPASIILVEGILLLYDAKVREFLDYSIYIDIPKDIRFIRRLDRDIKHRHRSVDSVINQYLTTVEPMFRAYVEPTKRYADMIVPGGGKNMPAVELVSRALKDLFAETN